MGLRACRAIGFRVWGLGLVGLGFRAYRGTRPRVNRVYRFIGNRAHASLEGLGFAGYGVSSL